ncbi:MAG TPA: transglycosylase [Draconibacterium sp.]|nr:transglycosylase [Draconibacterium sp.]
MKTAGIILLILGLAGVIIFGLQALNNSETFSLLGFDIAVSSANWTPVFVSGLILIVGFIMTATKRK